MVTRWRRRWTRRRLAGLIAEDEQLVLVERLLLEGWWVTTDRALYVSKEGAWSHVPLDQIRSVQWSPGQSTVTIRTARGDVILVSARGDSALAQRLIRSGNRREEGDATEGPGADR